MLQNYDWKRYWYKQGESPYLSNGFLYTHEYLKSVFTLDSALATNCLVLLGEPGMGKTEEIKRIYNNQFRTEDHYYRYFSLSSYGNENRLINDIFNSQLIRDWQDSEKEFHLFLDGLDECLLPNLPLILTDELENLKNKIHENSLKEVENDYEISNQSKLSKFFLRISCRTAEWASRFSVLESKLKEIWGNDAHQILQIAPLQAEDVVIAAKAENLNSKNFLDEVDKKNVTVFASKPVTLQLLFGIFNLRKSLPPTRTEIYKKGCLALCEEKNERRKALNLTGKLTPNQKLKIAARIAAMMIFGNKSSIWLGNIGEEDESDISLNDLAGFYEKEGIHKEIPVTQNEIKEIVFNTGLFDGKGNTRLKFSHQTYAEFLASWYLTQSGLSDEIIIKIIGEEYLYPQLYETSAWIANQRQKVFNHLMNISPQTYLRSDVLNDDLEVKEKLVEKLLELFDQEKIEGIDRNYYRNLNHPKIAEQLRPYIIDNKKNWLVVDEALDMALVCETKALQKDLLKITFSKRYNSRVRSRAASILTKIGDIEFKLKLKPLIFEKDESELTLELKGIALNALWNENVSAEKVFSVLTIPRTYITGTYEVFFHYYLVNGLKDNDLPIALRWVYSNLDSLTHSITSEKRFVDEILLKAWNNLDNDEIFEKFVDIVTNLLLNHRDVFRHLENKEILENISQENEKRRKVWLKITSKAEDKYLWAIESSRVLGLKIDDIEWLVTEWNLTDDKILKEKLIQRIRRFVPHAEINPISLDKVYKACQENEQLMIALQDVFAPIELNSEKEKQAKEFYELNYSWLKEQKKREEEWNKPIDPSPKQLSLEYLKKFENGESNAFWYAIDALRFSLNGQTEFGEFECDVTEFPVWKDSDNHFKLKIIKSAKEYLYKGNPQNDKWIGNKHFYYSALAGYKAIILLERFEPAFTKNLPKNIWEKWAAIIYYYPTYNNNDDQLQLIKTVYENTPEQIVKFLKDDLQNELKDTYDTFGHLLYCWDERLINALKDTLKNKNLSVFLTKKILSQLITLKDADVNKIICNLIKFPIPRNKRERQLIEIAIHLSLASEQIFCWESIWKIIINNKKFGKQIIEKGVSNFRKPSVQSLTEEQISELFVWVSKNYPHKKDIVHYGSYSPTARDDIKYWRDSLLDILKEKGTIKAVNELKNIKDAFPKLTRLNTYVLQAQEKLHATNWKPLSTSEFFNLIFIQNKKSEKTIKIVNNIVEIKDGSQNIVIQGSNNVELTQNLNEISNEIIKFLKQNLDKLNSEVKDDYESAKTGEWKTKFKLAIPLIKYLGINFETEREITADEVITGIRRLLLRKEEEVLSILNSESEPQKKLLT